MIAINIKVYTVIRKRYRSPIMKYTSTSFNYLKHNNGRDANSKIASERQTSLQLDSKAEARSFTKSKSNSLEYEKYEAEDVLTKLPSDEDKLKSSGALNYSSPLGQISKG
jgi:hypothetical protein